MSNGRFERQLINYLDRQGYHIMRAPSSGGGTKRDLPDLFWSRPGEDAIAAELKTRQKDTAYVSKGELESLRGFAAAFDAMPRIVLRVKGDTSFYMIHPDDGTKTDQSIKVERDDAYRTIDP